LIAAILARTMIIRDEAEPARPHNRFTAAQRIRAARGIPRMVGAPASWRVLGKSTLIYRSVSPRNFEVSR